MMGYSKSVFQRIIRYGAKVIERLTLLTIPFVLWFMLSGQFRKSYEGRPQALDGGNLSVFKFKQPKVAVSTPEWVYWATGGGLLAVALGFVFLIRFKKYQEEMQRKKVAEEKAHLRLDVILSKLNIILPERKLLEALANGASHPDDILPLVESVEDFEGKVTEFKKTKPDAKVLKSIYNLRHKLGFDVNNKRANFISTQMLAGGIKLECQIPHPTKQVLFVSTILTVSENGILLKPPTVKKKPVNLKRYPHLVCRIRRGEEADYEFQLPILNQIFGKPNAIVLGHTNNIKKMFIRESERVKVDIFTTFYAMTEEKLNSLGTGVSITKSDIALESVNGQIVDMSVGGLKAEVEKLPKNFEEGDLLIFHIQGANLREDMKARVLKINPRGSEYDIHMQFFRTRELERLKIKKFIFRTQKQTQQTNTQSAPPSTEQSSMASKPKMSPDMPKASDSVSSNERNALLQ